MRELHPISIEKKIIAVALLISAGHMILIAYAAYALGIEVPTCVTNVQPFENGSLVRRGERHFEVHAVTRMWAFEPNKVIVPTGSIVDLYVTSRDVVHGLHVAGTNANLNIVPRVVNYARIRFDRAGTYPMICHEYCGTGHQDMIGSFEVRDDVTEASVEGLPAPPPSAEGLSPLAANGLRLFQAKGCTACHSVDGRRGVGPTLKGLFGRQETLADGTSFTVDKDYVVESIRDPRRKIVQGFNPVMPVVPLTREDVEALAEYIATLH